MKKTISAVLAVFSLLFSGCIVAGGKWYTTDEIHAIEDFTGERLEIKIHLEKYEPAGKFCFFSTEKSLSEMKQVFDEAEITDGILETKIYKENCLFIKKIKSNQRVYYFLLALRSQNETEFYYEFISSDGSFFENGRNEKTALFPFHLVAGIQNYYDLDIEIGEAYELSGTQEEVVEFYKKCFALQVSETEETLQVEVYQEFVNEELYMAKSFQINFSQQEEKTFVTFFF